MSARPHLIFAGGHTAGHINPGLAVIDRLRTCGADFEFLFAGSGDEWERTLVRQAGVDYVGLPAAPWAGRSLGERLAVLGRIGPAVLAARRQLRAVNAAGLVGLGGFGSVVPALAARSLGLPVTLYEPNATLGLANRLLRPLARALLVSRLFGMSSPGTKVIEVGVPLRPAVLALAARRPEAPREKMRLLVLGGSLGNPFLNEFMPALAAKLQARLPGLAVLHQCGHGVEPGPLQAQYAVQGIAAQVRPYIDPITDAFKAADFVVSAAGAISLHELAAAGVPALIVPQDRGPGAHQLHNAAAFVRLTGSLSATRADWDEDRLAAVMAGVVGDARKWRQQQAGLRRLLAGDAAGKFMNAALSADLGSPVAAVRMA